MTDIEEALEIIWARCQHCKDVQEALEILRGERPHGKWEWKSPTPETIIAPHCSKCGHMNDFIMETNFCPNCGADMRKEGEAE